MSFEQTHRMNLRHDLNEVMDAGSRLAVVLMNRCTEDDVARPIRLALKVLLPAMHALQAMLETAPRR